MNVNDGIYIVQGYNSDKEWTRESMAYTYDYVISHAIPRGLMQMSQIVFKGKKMLLLLYLPREYHDHCIPYETRQGLIRELR